MAPPSLYPLFPNCSESLLGRVLLCSSQYFPECLRRGVWLHSAATHSLYAGQALVNCVVLFSRGACFAEEAIQQIIPLSFSVVFCCCFVCLFFSGEYNVLLSYSKQTTSLLFIFKIIIKLQFIDYISRAQFSLQAGKHPLEI